MLLTSPKLDNGRKIPRPILKSKRKILSSNFLKPSEISSHVFYRHEVNSWTSLCPFCCCYDGCPIIFGTVTLDKKESAKKFTNFVDNFWTQTSRFYIREFNNAEHIEYSFINLRKNNISDIFGMARLDWKIWKLQGIEKNSMQFEGLIVGN